MTSEMNRVERCMHTCPRFDRCSAPLCPLDPDLHMRDGWWTDEAICRHQGFQQLPMIRKQRRLARLAKRKGTVGDGFYSVGRLTETKAMPQKRSQTRSGQKVAI